MRPPESMKKYKNIIKTQPLKEGEQRCVRCDGGGIVYIFEEAIPSIHDLVCPKCNGEGKINWIEDVFGKQKKVMNFDEMENIVEQLKSYGVE